MTKTHLLLYLKQFGNVRGKIYGTFANVTFERKSDVANVLVKIFHKFANHTIKISVNEKIQIRYFKHLFMFDAEFVTDQMHEGSHTSQTTILKLNANCLHELFKRLKLIDLAKMATINTRFQRIAVNVFRMQYQRVTLAFQTEMEIQLILQQFGHLITDLTVIDMLNQGYKLIAVIDQYCAGTLRNLRLKGFTLLDPKYKEEILVGHLFKTLSKLVFNDCMVEWNLINSSIRKYYPNHVVRINNMSYGYGKFHKQNE